MNSKMIMLSLLFIGSLLNATVYQNGDGQGVVSDWKPLNNEVIVTPNISIVDDGELNSKVVVLNGISTTQSQGYKLGGHTAAEAWKNPNTDMSWKMKYSENFVIYIGVETTNGYKYLKYTSADTDGGLSSNGNYIHHGLGRSIKDGTWKNIARDLQADLTQYDIGNQILFVNEFRVLGSGSFDDIKLNTTVYIDGNSPASISDWSTFGGDIITNRSVTIVYDEELNSNVIALSGVSTAQGTGYKLGGYTAADAWKNPNTNMSWKMKYSENFVIYIGVETTNGYKYLKYTSANVDGGLSSNGNTVHYGLGTSMKDGTWKSIVRDLQADLSQYDAGNQILFVNEFIVRGAGRFDDIALDGMPAS